MKKVLILEDEPDTSRHMKQILEMKGWQVLVALNGEQAWEVFEKEKPQACLIDVHMPSGMDGLEVLRRIKESDKTVRCVMITCVDDDKEILKAEQLGADKYVVKPLDVEQLRWIMEYIER